MLKRKTPLKRGSKGLKKSPFRKGKPTKKFLDEDREFYLKIWNSRPHFCVETGVFLGYEPLSWMFHHLLEKSKYPEYRHETWNIVLVSFDTHQLIHSNIDKTPKIKFLREKTMQWIEAINNSSAQK